MKDGLLYSAFTCLVVGVMVIVFAPHPLTITSIAIGSAFFLAAALLLTIKRLRRG